jgi:hypothetical protein
VIPEEGTGGDFFDRQLTLPTRHPNYHYTNLYFLNTIYFNLFDFLAGRNTKTGQQEDATYQHPRSKRTRKKLRQEETGMTLVTPNELARSITTLLQSFNQQARELETLETRHLGKETNLAPLKGRKLSSLTFKKKEFHDETPTDDAEVGMKKERKKQEMPTPP